MTESFDSLAQSHYENFPVGSIILPAAERAAVRSVYAFARVADDFADEGDFRKEVRLERLDEWEHELKRALTGKSNSAFFRDVAGTIQKYHIHDSLFFDLITAFRMDARGTDYPTYGSLEVYCRHSANPIGRIVLQIFGSASDQNCAHSDAICTALQLTNFWQDIGVDIKRNRVYIPREDLERFGLTREDFLSVHAAPKVLSLMKFEVERTKRLFEEGKPLLRSVGRRFSFELRLTVEGGMKILEKIEAMGYDSFHHRPIVSTVDWITIITKSLVAG